MAYPRGSLGLTCFSCGHLMVNDEDLDLVKEPINWTEQTDRSAVCSTQSLKQHYFRHGYLWSSPCRAVFTLDNCLDKFENFQLSAVFQPVHWTSADDGTLHIPLTPDVVYAGNPPANYPNTVSMPEDAIWTGIPNPDPWPQFCALFHERCWSVLTQTLPSLPQHLDEFMATLYAAEREIYSPIAQTPENRPRIARYHDYLAKQRALGQFLHCDPWRIPELDISVSKARLARQWLRAEGPYPFALLPRVRLPLDVQMLIVDQLHDAEDVRSAMTAFEWQFPDGYWKARFPKDEDVHWPALYYHTQPLMRESHGLRKRQQIVNFAEYVRPWFDALVAKKQSRES
ncbi:hypothetical protein BJX96DRAFT_171974 [Aspergillus floccosus]